MNPQIFIHYRIGLRDIDESHWKILSLMSNIAEVTDTALACEMLETACDLFITDLKKEEKLILESNFPYSKPHFESHAKLIKSLENFKKTIPEFRNSSLKYAVSDWQRSFLDHIDQYDIQWANYLTAKS